MALWAYWLIAAIIALLAEIFTGTVYLLVISTASAGVALIAWLFQISSTASWLIAALLALLGSIWVYWKRRKNKQNEIKQDAINNDFDLGAQVILLQEITQQQWQVRYRGSIWEAKFIQNTHAQTGDVAIVVAKTGNLLHIKLPEKNN